MAEEGEAVMTDGKPIELTEKEIRQVSGGDGDGTGFIGTGTRQDDSGGAMGSGARSGGTMGSGN
ncbi:MAG: hypothetical protein ACK4K7_09915 [Allosphingosinicella sp.]|uniref:hypothetical protein n=1 Tax=Allosphingosinicella sp. TaxID=2823234 RepID=UPI00394D97C6